MITRNLIILSLYALTSCASRPESVSLCIPPELPTVLTQPVNNQPAGLQKAR